MVSTDRYGQIGQQLPRLTPLGNYCLAGCGSRRSETIRPGRGDRTQPNIFFRWTRAPDMRVGAAVAWLHPVPFKFTGKISKPGSS